MSDYQIEKLIISDHIVIVNVGPKCTSNYYCTDSIYDFFKYDMTFSKNSKTIFDLKSVQIISQPIDFDGELLTTKGVNEFVLSINKVSRNGYDVKFKRN